MRSNQEKSVFDGFPSDGYPLWDREALEEYLRTEPNPREQLDKWSSVEVNGIKRGRVYKCAHADTPQSRGAVYCKTLLFQMIAYLEDWEFDPNNYQVTFLPPDHPLVQNLSDGQMRRVFGYDSEERADAEKTLRQAGHSQPLSYENRAGFRIVGDDGVRIENDEADEIARQIDDALGASEISEILQLLSESKGSRSADKD